MSTQLTDGTYATYGDVTIEVAENDDTARLLRDQRWIGTAVVIGCTPDGRRIWLATSPDVDREGIGDSAARAARDLALRLHHLERRAVTR